MKRILLQLVIAVAILRALSIAALAWMLKQHPSPLPYFILACRTNATGMAHAGRVQRVMSSYPYDSTAT